MLLVENKYQRFVISLICWLVASFLAAVGFLHFFPGHGLIFLGFCFLAGFGMLPWFKGARALGFSAGTFIGITSATVVFFSVMPFD